MEYCCVRASAFSRAIERTGSSAVVTRRTAALTAFLRRFPNGDRRGRPTIGTPSNSIGGPIGNRVALTYREYEAHCSNCWLRSLHTLSITQMGLAAGNTSWPLLRSNLLEDFVRPALRGTPRRPPLPAPPWHPARRPTFPQEFLALTPSAKRTRASGPTH